MEKNLLKESEEKVVYETGLMPPQINPATDKETEESKAQRAALRQASVDMLFSTDISRLDDAGVGALYKSVTGGVWGIPDEDGSFFGKRKSADMRNNVEMLRRFFKGEYNLIEDKEAEEWRKKTWEEKFKYAKEHESAGNILASTVGGERGVTLGEMVYLGAISQNLSYQLMKDKESERAAKDISRTLNYNTMTKEEKRKYEADVISDYEKKLAKREPLVRFLSMSRDLSDRAAYLLAKSYREGKLDVTNILSLEEDEQLKVMTTFAEMRGDLTKGRIFGLETDFSTGTAGDRFQMGVYGLQQAVLSLGSDLYSFAKDSAVAAWAKVELDGKEREDFYKAWNTLERAKLFEKQSLPDAESFGGEAFQTFMENAHWVIPYWGAAKIAAKGKNVKRAIQAIDNLSGIKKAGKTAALKESLSVSLFTRLSPMKDGIKYADETIGKLLLSVDKYTRELQELGRMRSAYGAAKGGLDAAWLVARGSAFASFAEEYIDTATAAGVSREESILTAVWVGLVNDRIEHLVVPGLESTLTKGQLKSLGYNAFRRSLQEGTFGTYAENFMKRYLTEGVRVGVSEGWVEEPLQEIVKRHAIAVDRLAHELTVNGKSLGERIIPEIKKLLTFTSQDLKSYIETASEMVPGATGFAVMSIPTQLARRRIRNHFGAKSTQLPNYDEALADIYQREMNARKLIEEAWKGDGRDEGSGMRDEKEREEGIGEEGTVDGGVERGEEELEVEVTDALTKAREVHSSFDGEGDIVSQVAEAMRVDVKTAEAVVQILDEEAEVTRFDPRARSMIDQFFSGVMINEKTISTLLPGYIEGSFEADEENGVYVAKVKVARKEGDEWLNDGEKTIVYRRRDGVFFNPDGSLNEVELSRAAAADSSLGISYDERIKANGGDGRLWAELSDAERRREALIVVNGNTGGAGTVAFRRKDGTEVSVSADAIINLASGRLADIGYGMAARQSTVRHETFHALWKFAKELVSEEEQKHLASALAIDTNKAGWEDRLDEAMAHQMEEYASGHYVVNRMSTAFERFQAWAAEVFGAMRANEVKDTSLKARESELGQMMGEGTSFALKPFYDAVLQGKLGSGELGIEKVVVSAAGTNEGMRDEKKGMREDELPIEPEVSRTGNGEEEERGTRNGERRTDAPDPRSPIPDPLKTIERPEWDLGDKVIKRVPKKSYKLHCRLEVVNIHDGIRTSWSEGFDQANQGRDITSDDSQSLVEEIAGDPDYSKGGRVMEFTGFGAPLVSPTGDVLDGNHHMRGLQLAYERGGDRIEAFKEKVLSEAKSRGLEVSEHAAEAPIIICRFESVEVKEGETIPTIAQIAEDTNDTVQRGLNTYETAAKDARILISKNLIPLFTIDPETGLIKDEEEKKSDGKIVNPIGVFRQASKAQGILDDKGHITEEGQKRLMNGILAALLGGTNPKVVQAIMEKQIHLDMENEMRALMRLAPELLKLVNDEAKKDYDLRADILEALTWYQEWRNQDEEARDKAGKNKIEWRKAKTRPTAWVNYKGDMFSKPGEAAAILGDLFAASQDLRSFQSDGETETKAGRKRAQELIIREIKAYLQNVYATNTDTVDLLGDFTPPTKAEILSTQREKGGAYSVRLYHGSGADFTTPDLSHLGEGSGFAAQGHGFYLSSKESEAEYWGHVAAGYGYFAPAHESIFAKVGKYFSPVYLYEFNYDGDVMKFIDSQGPNIEAAFRVESIVVARGLKAPSEYFSLERRTTGMGIERFLQRVTKEDGSLLSQAEITEILISAGIDGVKEFLGDGLSNIFVVYNTGKLTALHKWRNGKKMFSVGIKKYSPKPTTQAEFDLVEERFGTTEDYTHAQWLLPSGKVPKPIMVKSSIGEYPSHDGLVKLVEREGDISDFGSYLDVLGGGAVRIKSGEGIEVARRPTDKQFEVLYDVIEKNQEIAEDSGEDALYVDVDNEVCETIFTASYPLKTSPGKILSDLRAWYDNGIMPEASIKSAYSTCKRKPLKTASDIAYFSYEHIFNHRGFDHYNHLDEQLSVWALHLDNNDVPMGVPMPVFLGTLSHTVMHPREMFRKALLWGAPKVAFIRTEPVRSSIYGEHKEAEHFEWMNEVAKLLEIKLHSWTILRSDGAYRNIDDNEFDDIAPSRGWVLPPKENSKKARLFFPDAGYEVESLVDWDDYAFGDYGRFSIGARKRAEYSRLIAKHRSDLTEQKIENILDIINGYENTKKEKLAVHWTITGAIILPQDEFKIDKAIITAQRAKVDPFRYKNPEEIFIAFPEHLPKERPIDPDTVSVLSNKTIFPQGIAVYDVDESEELTTEAKAMMDQGATEEEVIAELGVIRRPVGQLAMRQIINTHWGKDASPWCLLQGDDKGELTKASYHYWHHYKALPKKVAFRNGKLLSFMATDAAGQSYEQVSKWEKFFKPWRDEYYESGTGLSEVVWLQHTHPEVDLSKILPLIASEEWWDREDKSHEGIPIKGPIPGDKLGRSGVSEYVRGVWRSVGKLWKGSKENGRYEEWSTPEQRSEVSNWKNGEYHGPVWQWWNDGGLRTFATYKEGMPIGDMIIFDLNGRISRRDKFDENGVIIGPSVQYWRNQLSLYREYGENEKVKRILSFAEGGKLSSYRKYDEGGELYTISVDLDTETDNPSKVLFVDGDLRYRIRFTGGELYEISIMKADGSTLDIGYHITGEITKVMEADPKGKILKYESWWYDDSGKWSQITGTFADGTRFRFTPTGVKTIEGREATEEEKLTEPHSLTGAQLESNYPELKGLMGKVKSTLEFVETERKEIIAKELAERGEINIPKFSTRLRRAKRDAILRPKSAIAQLELDLFAERKEVKGERKKRMIEEADGYKKFIAEYRPIMEEALLRGNWKAALDFADKHSMPIASNILKDYYREPEFNTTELIGQSVKSVEDAASILMTVRSPFIESTKAIYLDRYRRILDAKILTIGQIGQAMIRKGTLLRHMPKKTAYVIFAHNHPSGNPSPSKPDKSLTVGLKHELKTLGVKLLDHIITNGSKFYSFNYQTTLPCPEGVEAPKWEVVGGLVDKVEKFSNVPQVGEYLTNFLRDDGEAGHIIYLNNRNVTVGVRRIPLLSKFEGDIEEYAKIAALGAESSAAVSAFVDFGAERLTFADAKDALMVLAPTFGVRGVSIIDAFMGSGEEIVSLRNTLTNWKGVAKDDFEETTRDLFNYPKYSIASRKIDWDKLPASLDRVVNSTTVTHLTGQDANPEKYEIFKFYRDRYMLDEARPLVDRWLEREESKWLAKYLLGKYYGDLESALEVVKHRFSRRKVPALKSMVDFEGKVKWLYVRNNDGKRTNRLPEAYAILLADYFGGEVETGIMKVSDERNTGATLKERVSREFQFDGKVEKGAQYVIVDDVWTSGQTTVSLMEYILKKGGTVPAVTTLAVAANGSRIKPTAALLQRTLQKGRINTLENARKILGVDLRKATGSELQAYIVKGTKGTYGIQDWFSNAAPTLPLDFTRKGRSRGRKGDTSKASGTSIRRDLFGYLSSEERRHLTTKPSQGVFKFSTHFPRLSELDDDSLIAAALASRLALDRKEKMQNALNFDTVKKMVEKAHPAMTGEELRSRVLTVRGDTLKLARKIRQGLDKGVSESAILKALDESLRPKFESEMRREAREGAKVGAFGAKAESFFEKRTAQVLDEAVRVESGVESDVFEAWAGVDFTETLLKALHNERTENDGVYASKKKKKEDEGEDDSTSTGAAGGGESAEGTLNYSIEEMENPRAFAEYLKDLVGKYWREKHGLGEGVNPWMNRLAVQFLRKTAANIYTKLVKAIMYSQSRDTAFKAILKLENIPTERGIVSQMAYIGEIIHARHIREKRQELCEKLDELLKKAFGATGRFKPDKEELKRKVTAEAELRARYMRHAMWLTPDAAREEAGELSRNLTGAMVEYEEAGRDMEQSRIYVETIRKLSILREFGALKYKTPGEIESAYHYWEELAEGARDEILEAMETRENRTKAAAAIFAKAFFNRKRSHAAEGGFKQTFSNYLLGHMGFAALMQDLMRYADERDRDAAMELVEYLMREIQKAGDRSAAEMRRHGDEFHEAVEKIYRRSFKKVMSEMNREDLRFEKFMGLKGGKRVMPTKGRAMQLMVSLLQGEKKNSHYYENVRKWKREGEAGEIAKLLSAEDINMVSWIGKWYEVNRAELSGVSESLFGIGVYSEAANYFPVKMLLERQGLEKVEGVAWTIFPKALTPRISNLRDFDTSADIFAIWSSRMEEAAQWKGHAKLGLELRGIFGRSQVQEVIAANHGPKANRLILGYITDILAGHGAYDRTTNGIEWVSDQIRGWTALCALGGNVGVTFKQMTSIPAFGFEIGLVKTAKYVAQAFTPAGIEAMKKLFASEQRKTRWQVGNTEAVKNALQRSDAGWFKRMMQASMITNKIGDMVPGLVVGQGIYRDCIARGMSEENAMAQTWMIIERTQQSGRMENQTSVQRRNRLGRMMYQFLTTQQQYLQYEVKAIRAMIADPSLKNAEGVARTVILNHFILTSLYYWMGELYKAILGAEPPEDQIADWVVGCLLGPYNSLFVLGFCCKATLDRFLKGGWAASRNDLVPMESFVKRTIGDSARVMEAVFSEERTTDELIDAIADLAAGLNPIVRDARRVIESQK